MRKPIPLYLFLVLVWATTANGNDAAPQVRLLVSNPAPFVGEEFILALEVRTSGRPGAIIPRWPGLDPFAASDLAFPPPRRETSGTTTWLVQRGEKSLIPLAPGTFTLTGAGVQAGGAFAPAAPVNIRVRPLPAHGRPTDFAGAVGEVAMTLSADGSGSREVALTLRGHAPLNAFPRPVSHLGSGERLVPLGESFSGAAPGERQRTWRYLYLPGAGREGELHFTLAIFHPQKEGYAALTAGIGRSFTLLPWLTGGLLLLATAAFACGWWRGRHPLPRSLPEVLTRLVGQPASGLSRRQIERALRRRGVSSQLLSDLRHHWAAEDAARFAPGVSPSLTQQCEAAAGLARRLRKAVDKWPRIS